MNRRQFTACLRPAALVLAVLVAGALLSGWLHLVAPARAAAPAPTPSSAPPAAPASPDISFIENPTAQCVRAQPGKDVCYINWNYLYVTAATGQYMISMTVQIDGRLRANVGGFFQNSMFIPGQMFGPGFKVACGPPSAAGDPRLGRAYNYQVHARDSEGLKAANYGQVTCPSDIVPPAAAALSGPAAGLVGRSSTFTATVSPMTTTMPLSYSWDLTGQTTITATGNLSASQSFLWDAPGVYTLTVTAANPADSAAASAQIFVQQPLYLPLVRRN